MSGTRLVFFLASAMGGVGVALLAAGAHAGGAGLFTTAGQVLLFHAPAVMAGALAREQALLPPRMGATALGLLVFGAALFSADLALREAGSARLFRMAAPLGGTTMMIGWAVLAISALYGRTR